MGLEQSSDRIAVGDYFANTFKNEQNFNAETQHIQTKVSEIKTLSMYMNEKAIADMIKVNSEIENILGAFKLPIKINIGILNNLIRNHLPHTRKIALGMTRHLCLKYKKCVDYKALSEATVLHDLAKVIIPESIVNKQGKLDASERAIMQKHADLSYELLKNTDLDKKTLDLIKNHHHDNEEYSDDVNLQILSMADIYSALRERRSYKEPMSIEKSLGIIESEVEKGKFDREIFDSLVKYAKEEKLSFDEIAEKLYLLICKHARLARLGAL